MIQGGARTEQVASDVSKLNRPSFSDNSGDSRYIQMGINSYSPDRSWWQKALDWF